MPTDGSTSSSLEVVDRFDDGVGWIAHPEETIRRTSHAIARDGEVWLFDPVDAAGLDELLSEYGDVAGVVVLLDRHERDSTAIARRHGVSVYVPEWMSGLEAAVELFADAIAGFDVDRLIGNPVWQEAVAFDGETLLVPEALGTVPYFLTDDERLGVHPMLRLKPPRTLREYDADRLLVGHGEGVPGNAEGVICEAVDGARSKTLPLYWKDIKSLLG